MAGLSARPIPFEPGMEQPEPDEARIAAEIVETMRGIQETTWTDYGHAVRSVHAKSHGLLKATLVVPDGLPPDLAHGLFARPGSYDVVMRFSTNPGDILDDSVSTPRGLAIKILGVSGERLPGSDDASTQDFVMVDGPAFSARNADAFLGSLKLLAKTTDTPQGWKTAFSALARGAEAALEAVGGESATLKNLGGQPATHILGETFHTQVPHLYGPYAAKISVAPVSLKLTALTDAPVEVNGRPNGIRDAVTGFFRAHGAEWELRVQLRTNADTMPIEDASIVWPEEESPFVTVASIRAEPQDAWSEARSAAVDDAMSFSPWHGLAAHRPLGSIMRVRKPSYEISSGFRASHNGCPIHEPRNLDGIPG